LGAAFRFQSLSVAKSRGQSARPILSVFFNHSLASIRACRAVGRRGDRRRVHSWLKNLKKSIDTLLLVQLKDAPSPVFACSAPGEGTTGKNKNSGKNRKKR